jgi:tryptophanyl-tRNA synthetase
MTTPCFLLEGALAGRNESNDVGLWNKNNHMLNTSCSVWNIGIKYNRVPSFVFLQHLKLFASPNNGNVKRLVRRGTSHRHMCTAKVEQLTSKKLRVVSGVQPTGYLHIGNYLGALRQWVLNQDKYENLFFVVDLHAITVPQDPKGLADATLSAAALFLACGIDPSKSTIFIQSHVKAHVELCWLLNCITPMGWLERMIQFKEKARKQGENVSVGLFDYPVLMASDILLYQADLVPVGEDQQQHLELVRSISKRFNSLYGKKKKVVLKEPKPLIQDSTSRIMALDDGTSKMSKSSPNDNSRINILDPPDTVKRKIQRCKTDSFMGIVSDPVGRPECTNLLNIYAAFTDQSLAQAEATCREMSWGQFKKLLTDALIAYLEPIQTKYHELRKEESYLKQVLKEGSEYASSIAQETIGKVKDCMGFVGTD